MNSNQLIIIDPITQHCPFDLTLLVLQVFIQPWDFLKSKNLRMIQDVTSGLPVDAEAQGITPLSEAAAAGKTEVVQMLLERKVRRRVCLESILGIARS